MSPADTTYAALLTPLAPGAIAVIGLAGPRTLEISGGILWSPRGDSPIELHDRRPVLCRIVEHNRTLDDAIVVRVARKAGDTVELHTHGGIRIAQRVLRLLEQQGARIIDGVNFREKLSTDDRIQLDADAALLTSRSRRLTEWLLLQRAILPAYLANVEGESAEDFEEFSRRSHAAIALVAGAGVAIVGPPNAGKSTLANRFIGSEEVITSTVAGTTRDWVSQTAMINGWPVTLTDTAGIRDSDCAIEAEAIRRGRSRAREADLILLLLDGTLPPERQHLELHRVTAEIGVDKPRLVVRNKRDLVARTPAEMDEDSCFISALTGEGMEQLEARVASVLGIYLLAEDLPAAFRGRQLAACSQRRIEQAGEQPGARRSRPTN